MKFRNMMLKYYSPAGEDGEGGGGGGAGEGGSGGGEGGGEGGEGGGEGGKPPAKEPPAKKEPGGEGGEGGEGGKPKLSDNEAQLLKDLMKHKETAKSEKAARKALEAKLKEFEGIDPTAVRELLAKQQKAQEEELEKKGQWDALKQNMIKAHSEDKAKLEAQITELQGALKSRDNTIDELTIGSQFGNSKFLKEETTLASAAKARALYGNHFELVDGVLTAFDKPKGAQNRAPLVDASGNALDFDSAMRKIIESDPDKDALLRTAAKPGAGSGQKAAIPPKKAGETKEDATSVDKIAQGLAGLNIQTNNM